MNDSTLLFRQVNPSWFQNGRVTSQAFRPTPKDEFKLSVYDGDLIDAEASWQHFTKTLDSIGTLALTVSECHELELEARPDPFPEHAVIDFSGLRKNQIETKSKKLRVVADARGWQFQPKMP